jgi:hypothetical protein
MGWHGLDSFGTGEGPVEDPAERSNASSGSTKCWEILE